LILLEDKTRKKKNYSNSNSNSNNNNSIHKIGKSHGVIGDCLREDIYFSGGEMTEGYGFEKVFIKGKVDCYYSGKLSHCIYW
jgi:hypothetical protein